MRGQVERLTKLATDLLDLSRLDAGRLAVEREDVDLAELTESVAVEFRGVAERANRTVEVDAEGSVLVLGDEQRLRQIASILLENALVHSPPGAAITVRARTANGRARLEVVDRGPGVPADHAERIFDRFYRAAGGVAAGSGLGLAIARELAALMGGRVELVSRADPTVFALDLPESTSSDTEPAAAAEARVFT